ncbi:MAG: uracil phosphoribosyltransferase [Candidatus Kariarchaeaceae archaeon]|jgi:uracil phosphoribosyltransferase
MLVDFRKSALLEESIAIIRDEVTNSSVFRSHLRKIGRYLIYEASKDFETVDTTVKTPLSEAKVKKIKQGVTVISVLRAALPMVDAVFEEFADASLGVASASRGEMLDTEGKQFEIKSDYMKIPPLEGRIVILVDPMLATASTILYILEEISKESPKMVVLLSAIASQYGVDMIETQFPEVKIYVAAIDEVLNSKGYIVPGLGDAGDRACNTPH